MAIPLGLFAAGALVMTGGVASGAPQPTVTQIQQKLNKLNTQADKLDDQFNQVQQELTSANQRLALVNKQAARYLVTFDAMRTQVAQIAAQQFENSALTTPEALLTSGDPQEILNQSSILLELSSSNRSAMRQYFAAARRLEGAQQSARRAKDAIASLKTKLASKKTTLKKAIAQQQSLLAQLTPAQNTGLGAGGTTVGQFTGPTNTQAEKAVAFAYNALGCPYVFGGTGPCGSGYDCSGLTMQAWASAGVSISAPARISGPASRTCRRPHSSPATSWCSRREPRRHLRGQQHADRRSAYRTRCREGRAHRLVPVQPRWGSRPRRSPAHGDQHSPRGEDQAGAERRRGRAGAGRPDPRRGPARPAPPR